MAKKKDDLEKELDMVEEPKQVKKPTFVTSWFDEYAVNDKKEMKQICDLTARSVEEQFGLYIKSGNTEVYAIIFYATFKTILEYLKSKQSRYSQLNIEICNSINVGYTNNDDEENEKVGNFMPILEFIGTNRNIVNNISDLDLNRTSENYLRWKELNVKKNIEQYKEIQEKAYDLLKTEYKTNLRNSEAVIPLFATFMDFIPQVAKAKFLEAKGTDISEVSFNVLGLFDVFYSFNEEAEDGKQEIIEYQPNVMTKLMLKQDNVAARD